MYYKKIKQIAKGWSSYIWLAKDARGRAVVIKEVREKSNRKDLAHREGRMLALANSIGVGPKLIEANLKENFVAMEYIRGEKLFDWVVSDNFSSVSKLELYNFVKELFRQALLLDSIGLRHSQLQVGKNILVKQVVRDGKKNFVPIIIDFEKASIAEHNDKNVGQILSFLFYNPNGIVAKKVREKLGVEI